MELERLGALPWGYLDEYRAWRREMGLDDAPGLLWVGWDNGRLRGLLAVLEAEEVWKERQERLAAERAEA